MRPRVRLWVTAGIFVVNLVVVVAQWVTRGRVDGQFVVVGGLALLAAALTSWNLYRGVRVPRRPVLAFVVASVVTGLLAVGAVVLTLGDPTHGSSLMLVAGAMSAGLCVLFAWLALKLRRMAREAGITPSELISGRSRAASRRERP